MGDEGVVEEEVVQSVVEEAAASGLDLRDYSARVEKELGGVQAAAVQAHKAQAGKMAGLHRDIVACDSVLARMEEMLARFQADLGSISSEILSLQEQSVEMNVRLKNRQALRSELSQFVDDLVIPDWLITTILEAPVTERAFLEALHELQHKMGFLKEQEARDALAVADIAPVIANLRIKAVEKIREWLMLKVYSFRKPLSNYQVAQSALLKFRFYYEFLLSQEPDIAREVREEYVNTLSKTLYSYIKTYHSRLQRLVVDDVPLKEDLLGADDSNKSVGMFSLSKTVRNRAAVFSMGERAKVVREELEAPVIVPHAAQEAAQKFHQEALLRSLGFSIVEHACHEHHFLHDFFLAKGDMGRELFHRVMGKSVGILSKAVEDQGTSSHDAIGLYLSIQLLYRFQGLMQQRGALVLDAEWDRLLGVLWARFELVMGAHTESLRGSESGGGDTRPHFVVRRYAELVSGLLAVSGLGEPGGGWGLERLQPLLARLETEMETFVVTLAGKARGGRKGQLVCQVNNWDLVASVLGEQGVAETREGAVVRETLSTTRESFVEELLFPHFGALVNFVNQTEPLANANETQLLARYSDKVPNLVRSFGDTWKTAIEEINKEVLASFTNFKCGTAILQQALTALVQYYHRFQKVLSHTAFASCQARHQLVNIHHIMVELKKYKSAF